MALSRRHWRFVVRDQYGFVIQNAKVNVFQPGTSNNFVGSAFTADTGGSGATNPFTTNAQGEVEAWFDTAQVVDVQVDDNSDTAYRAVNGASATISFTTFVEADQISVDSVDLPTTIGTTTDLQPILATAETEAVGTSTRWSDAAHIHGHSAFSANPHDAADHTNATKKVWLSVNDGAVMDGGTLTTTGTNPDALRTISLADAASTGAAWTYAIEDCATGTLSIQIYWAGSTTNANPPRFQLDCVSKAHGADITGGGITVAFTGTAVNTANFLIRETLTNTTMNINNGELIRINVRRLGSDGADTYTGAVLLIGIMLSYTAVQ